MRDLNEKENELFADINRVLGESSSPFELVRTIRSRLLTTQREIELSLIKEAIERNELDRLKLRR